MNPTRFVEYDLGPHAYPLFHKAASSSLEKRQMRPSSVVLCTTVVQRPAVQRPAVQRPAVQRPTVQKPTVQKPAVQRPASPTPSCASTPSIEFHGLEHKPPVPLDINEAPKNGITHQRRHQRNHRHECSGSRRSSTTTSRRSRPSWADEPAIASSSHSRSNRGNRSTIVSSGRSHPSWMEHYATTTTSHLRYTRGNQDLIDSLDNAAPSSYHHEGPYDAVSRARNRNPSSSPLRALANQTAGPSNSNRKEKSNDDSLNSHRPLPSQPLYPPGTVDREGRVYDYEEGANHMFDTMRLPGYRYTDSDFNDDPFYTDPYPEPIDKLRKTLAKLAFKVRSTSREGKRRLSVLFNPP